jgi:hypothetical protein
MGLVYAVWVLTDLVVVIAVVVGVSALAGS